MSEHDGDHQNLAARLAEWREEGAALLARRPAPGSSDHARLSLIDAKIEELTRLIKRSDGQPPTPPAAASSP